MNKLNILIKHFSNTRQKKGFTLIEVLISIAIMATIATIGYTTVDMMIKTETNLKDTDKILNQIQKTFTQWQSDCTNIEMHDIPNLTHNIKIINNNQGNPQSLWMIRRNIDIQTKQSIWQLIIYTKSLINDKEYEWERIATEPTSNSNELLKQISNIDSILKYEEIKKVSLIPIQNFNINIWQELKWKSYIQLNNQIPIRGIQLNIELPENWKGILGKTQKFNCITKVN